MGFFFRNGGSIIFLVLCDTYGVAIHENTFFLKCVSFLFAAEDSSLRVFSTITDLLNKSFGVASYNRKLSKKHKQIDNSVKMEPIIGKIMDFFLPTCIFSFIWNHRDNIYINFFLLL